MSMAEKLYRFSARLPCRLIKRQGIYPYLERYYLGRFCGLTFYLHRFVASDGDEAVHDHPWHALSIVLCGWYKEEVVTENDVRIGWRSKWRTIFPGRPNFISKHKEHRICYAKPETWSLVVHTPHSKGWGFKTVVDDKYSEGSPFMTVYHQPFKMSNGRAWWNEAPQGQWAQREPMP